MDRSINMFFPNISKDFLKIVMVSSLILAAKMEQPMNPSINMMLKLLTEEERRLVTKENVIQMEEALLFNFDFDLSLMTSL